MQKHKTKVGSLFSKWTFLVFQEMSKSYKPQQSLAKGGVKNNAKIKIQHRQHIMVTKLQIANCKNEKIAEGAGHFLDPLGHFYLITPDRRFLEVGPTSNVGKSHWTFMIS